MKLKFVLLCFMCAFLSKINVSHGLDVIAANTDFDNHGVLAAFGDYNGDKMVDVFVINTLGKHLVKAGDIDPVTVKIANWLLIRQPEL